MGRSGHPIEVDPDDFPGIFIGTLVGIRLGTVDEKTGPGDHFGGGIVIGEITFTRKDIDDQIGVEVFPFGNMGLQALEITSFLDIKEIILDELAGGFHIAG